LLVGWLASMCQVDTRQQHSPGPGSAGAVPHHAGGHPAFEGLGSGDHAVLASG